MCNLYRMTRALDEVAKLFSTSNQLDGANLGSEAYPGYPGAVIAAGALRKMTWGFPLVLKSKKTGEPLKPKPVNNARTDKLDTFFWRSSFENQRCLIPVEAWAEAEGPRGAKTRTWLSLPEADVFAVAGVWRDSDEWGPVYAMVMTDASAAVTEVHSRMPVVLSADDTRGWLEGSPQEARALCRPCGIGVHVERTSAPWTPS